MKKDVKVVVHESKDTDTSIFYKCGYKEGRTL